MARYNKHMSNKDIDYQALNDELQAVLVQLDKSNGDIDAAIKQYERGMEIVGQLEAYLKDAENKVKKVQQQWDNPEAL